eukprot:94033-Pleurochrysis_carterae.AAC.2
MRGLNMIRDENQRMCMAQVNARAWHNADTCGIGQAASEVLPASPLRSQPLRHCKHSVSKLREQGSSPIAACDDALVHPPIAIKHSEHTWACLHSCSS